MSHQNKTYFSIMTQVTNVLSRKNAINALIARPLISKTGLYTCIEATLSKKVLFGHDSASEDQKAYYKRKYPNGYRILNLEYRAPDHLEKAKTLGKAGLWDKVYNCRLTTQVPANMFDSDVTDVVVRASFKMVLADSKDESKGKVLRISKIYKSEEGDYTKISDEAVEETFSAKMFDADYIEEDEDEDFEDENLDGPEMSEESDEDDEDTEEEEIAPKVVKKTKKATNPV